MNRELIADIGKFDSGTTCVLVPNTTVGGILKASPFEILLDQQLAGVKRSLFYTLTVSKLIRIPISLLVFLSVGFSSQISDLCLCLSRIPAQDLDGVKRKFEIDYDVCVSPSSHRYPYPH